MRDENGVSLLSHKCVTETVTLCQQYISIPCDPPDRRQLPTGIFYFQFRSFQLGASGKAQGFLSPVGQVPIRRPDKEMFINGNIRQHRGTWRGKTKKPNGFGLRARPEVGTEVAEHNYLSTWCKVARPCPPSALQLHRSSRDKWRAPSPASPGRRPSNPAPYPRFNRRG